MLESRSSTRRMCTAAMDPIWDCSMTCIRLSPLVMHWLMARHAGDPRGINSPCDVRQRHEDAIIKPRYDGGGGGRDPLNEHGFLVAQTSGCVLFRSCRNQDHADRNLCHAAIANSAERCKVGRE